MDIAYNKLNSLFFCLSFMYFILGLCYWDIDNFSSVKYAQLTLTMYECEYLMLSKFSS